jgi:hypothetical protein
VSSNFPPKTQLAIMRCYLLGFVQFHSIMFANLSVIVGIAGSFAIFGGAFALVRIANVPAITLAIFQNSNILVLKAN